MKRILLTGFRPFLNNETNPTEAIARRLGGTVLEVAYEAVDAFLGETDFSDYDAVLSLGLAAKSTCPRLEACAYNETTKAHPDVRGVIPLEPFIMANEEPSLKTSLDVDALVAALNEKGYECSRSVDPGRYLCNYVYYGALRKTHGNALFVHFPPVSKEWTIERMTSFIRLLLKHMKSAPKDA